MKAKLLSHMTAFLTSLANYQLPAKLAHTQPNLGLNFKRGKHTATLLLPYEL